MSKYQHFEDLPVWQEAARLYNRVLDLLEEPGVRDDAKEKEDREPAQVPPGERRPSRLRAPKLNRESGAEEQRERPVRLLFDEPPDERPDGRADGIGVDRLDVEVHDDHAQQGETAQDVERLDPFRRNDAEIGRTRRGGQRHGEVRRAYRNRLRKTSGLVRCRSKSG